MKRFWMVMGKLPPSHKHDTRKSATDEAERLARQCPGKEFTVLESVATVVKSEINWVRHVGEFTEQDVPF